MLVTWSTFTHLLIVLRSGRAAVRHQIVQIRCERCHGSIWSGIKRSRFQQHPTCHHFLDAQRNRRLCSSDRTHRKKWKDGNCYYICQHEHTGTDSSGSQVSFDGSRPKASDLIISSCPDFNLFLRVPPFLSTIDDPRAVQGASFTGCPVCGGKF